MTIQDRAVRDSIPSQGPIRRISSGEFTLFQKLILEEAGIFLAPTKKELLMGRLNRRLRSLGLETFGDYYQRVTKEDREERVRMINAICTHETRFFREAEQFKFLDRVVLPELTETRKRKNAEKHIRILSVGCSTGEEPYSLAMVFLDRFSPSQGWKIEITGGDISTRVLAAAKNGVWPIQQSDEIPDLYLKKFMLKGFGSKKGTMKAGQEIRSVMSFKAINLNHKVYPLSGSFDLIFCRNVMIYFNAEVKAEVFGKLRSFLKPGGYFFLGLSESLMGISNSLEGRFPAVYQYKV